MRITLLILSLIDREEQELGSLGGKEREPCGDQARGIARGV